MEAWECGLEVWVVSEGMERVDGDRRHETKHIYRAAYS